MKIAKIFIGDPDNQKGFFNNVIERTIKLSQNVDNLDCYILRLRYIGLLDIFKRQYITSAGDYIEIGGIKFKNLWLDIDLYKYLMSYKFRVNLEINTKLLNNLADKFSNYDLISCHGVQAICLARLIHKKYKVPYVATWHGSDINVTPFLSKKNYSKISDLLENADHNFFVSKKLLDTSNDISKKTSKSVLYTGPSDNFKKYTAENIKNIKSKYSIRNEIVIGYVGNLVSIKNVLVLPEIFCELQKKINGEIKFLIIGDGEMYDELKSNLRSKGVKNYTLLGNQNKTEMPNIMNIIDILLLPSLNEGMPRVVLEAYKCGVHVVGSNRGGILEAVGEENAFEIDENFISNVVTRIAYILNKKVQPPILSNKFSWENAINQELSIYRDIHAKSKNSPYR